MHPSQLALAWVLAQGKEIVPIPGTRKISRLEENLGVLHVKLTPQDLMHLSQLLPPKGERYAASHLAATNR